MLLVKVIPRALLDGQWSVDLSRNRLLSALASCLFCCYEQEYDRSKMAAAFHALSKPMRICL